MDRQHKLLGDIIVAYEGIDETRDVIEAKAKAFNCTVEWCRPQEAQVDLDSLEDWDLFLARWEWFNLMLAKAFPNRYYAERPSKSNNGIHVTVFLGFERVISEEERILIACLLGSDLKREILNYARLKKHGDSLSCLFKPGPKCLPAIKVLELGTDLCLCGNTVPCAVCGAGT